MAKDKKKGWAYNLFFKDAPLIPYFNNRRGDGWVPNLCVAYEELYADVLPRLAVSPYRMSRIKDEAQQVRVATTVMLWTVASPLLLPLTLLTSCLAIGLAILLAAISPITFLIAGMHDVCTSPPQEDESRSNRI